MSKQMVLSILRLQHKYSNKYIKKGNKYEQVLQSSLNNLYIPMGLRMTYSVCNMRSVLGFNIKPL